MLETDLNLTAEIKLYYDLFVPENTEKPAPLLLAVHGYGAHKRYMMREAKLIAPEDFVVASIQAPHQHYRQTDDGYKIGFGWLTDYKSDESIALHHQFARRLIEKLSKENLIDARQVYLFGFSQACALDFRFAFTNPDAVRGVIGVCGGIPSDLETNALYKILEANVFYLYGDEDEFYALEKFQTFERKLKKILPNFESKLYRAKHEITNAMREDMRTWIREMRDEK
ncbi:MAG: alpha/beta hydrolase [Pyrinomonadaceae bacterium]